MSKIKVILVDDERLAREELKANLSEYQEIEIIGTASNADEAEDLISTLQPDLIFLDISMPERDGFDLLESLSNVPEVIFTTAFDEYAVKAFDLNALDYLLKPIRKERFEEAIKRVKAKLITKPSVKDDQTLFVKDGPSYHLIKVDEIFKIESIGNYSRLYFGDKKVFFKRSLNQLEKMLDQKAFFRINRTIIINTSFVKQMITQTKGQLLFTMTNNEELQASVRQSSAFKQKNMI